MLRLSRILSSGLSLCLPLCVLHAAVLLFPNPLLLGDPLVGGLLRLPHEFFVVLLREALFFLVSVVDQVLKKLRPGGILILETPDAAFLVTVAVRKLRAR